MKGFVYMKISLILKLFSLCAIIISLFIPTAFCKDKPIEIGVTFSQVQCVYLNIDWKEEYLNVLSKDFAVIRLGSYWSEIEKEEGVYDFSILDWQIEEAEKRGVPIMLTVGMKAPRWPEFFIPEWVLDEIKLKYSANVSKNDYLCERVLIFIEKVVLRYKDKNIIQYWQVENEPLNHTGHKRWWIGKRFLKEEIELVKKLDNKNRPIVVNTAVYTNRFLRLMAGISTVGNPIKQAIDLGDILGINVYKNVGDQVLRNNVYYGSRKEERIKHFNWIVQEAKKKDKSVIVTELQAEPWDPGLLVHTGKEKAITCSPSDTEELFDELTSAGINTVLLWGVEYWDFRKDTHGEKEWWDKVYDLMGDNIK